MVVGVVLCLLGEGREEPFHAWCGRGRRVAVSGVLTVDNQPHPPATCSRYLRLASCFFMSVHIRPSAARFSSLQRYSESPYFTRRM